MSKNIRTLDELGRIVLPAKVRKILDINTDDYLEIFIINEKIILKKRYDSCEICGSQEALREFQGKYICEICCRELISLIK